MKKFTVKSIKKLENLLDQNFSLQDIFVPVPAAKYSITMDNDYLSPTGIIIKKQHLEAVYTRILNGPLSQNAADFIYTWEKVCFSSQNKKTHQELIAWTFAQGRSFNYYKTYENKIFSSQDINTEKQDNYSIGTWYDDLVNVPAVNLLYMLTWDILTFEEFNSALIHEDLSRVGDAGEITGNVNVQLNFKGCASEHSFFKNGSIHAQFTGLSLYEGRVVCIYEFRSAGRLNVQKEHNETRQEGESFFLGKMALNISNGDVLWANLIELLTVSITNKQGKIIPMQKRRLVQLENLS